MWQRSKFLLFGSGGPVLLLPTSDTAFHLEVATIAWDGSRAAARAVRDALPIIAHAKKVVVLIVTDDKPLDSTLNEALAEHLRYRGVTCEFRRRHCMLGDGRRPVSTAHCRSAGRASHVRRR